MPFTRPTLSDLVARADADLAARLTAGELGYSDRKVLARLVAGAAHGMYGHLDWLARQVIPDTAETAYLERWALLFGLERKAVALATGGVTFTGGESAAIPEATVLVRSDGVAFETDAEVTIGGGTATAAVTAIEGGAAGNTDAGEALSLVSPLAGIDPEAAVAAGGLTGGLDAEADAALLARLLLRIRNGAPNGKAGDYVQWALEIEGVTRAWDYPNHTGLGTVGVTFVQDNDDMDTTITPNSGQVDAMQAHIDAQRPMPADVTVFAPTAVALNFTIQVTPDTPAVRANVEAELKDLLRRDAEPGGTLYLSRIREAISLAEGETDHVLVSPVANVVRSTGEITVMGTITWA